MHNSMAEAILSRKDGAIENLTRKIREIQHIPQEIKRCRLAIEQLEKDYQFLASEHSQTEIQHQIARQAKEIQHILIDLKSARHSSQQNFQIIQENISESNQLRSKILELEQYSAEKAKQTEVILYSISKLKHSREEQKRQLEIEINDKMNLMNKCDRLCEDLQSAIKQTEQLDLQKAKKQGNLKLREKRLEQLEKHQEQLLNQQTLQKRELQRCRDERSRLKQTIYVKKSAEGIKDQITESKNAVRQLSEKAVELTIKLKETQQTKLQIFIQCRQAEDRMTIEKTLSSKLRTSKQRYLKENNRISQQIDCVRRKIEKTKVRNCELMDSLEGVFECNNRLQNVLGRYMVQS